MQPTFSLIIRLPLFAAGLLTVGRATAAEPPPNIVLILADDLGYGDVGCFGSQDISTPHLDSLATQGAQLTSFYAQPFCTPCRYSLLTGRHPNRSGGRLMVPLMRAEREDDTKGLRAEEVTVAELLQDAGYQTAMFGKWHLGQVEPRYLPTHHGFDTFTGHSGGCVDFFTLRYGNIADWYHNGEISDETGYVTDIVTQAASDFLRRQEPGRPFFLYMPFSAPHYAKVWDEATSELQNVLQAKPETIERLAHITDPDRRTYAAMVVELDEAIGQLLVELQRSQLEDTTWVVFASDNGADLDFGGNNDPLRGEKGTLWEGGVRTPCIMRWPGRISPGSVCDEPLSVLDFFPTVAKLVNRPTVEQPLDGIDLRPMLFSGTETTRDIFFDRSGEGSLRRDDWKYIRHGDDEMLFNLQNDISERTDLAAVHPLKLQELRSAHAQTAQMLSASEVGSPE